MKKKITKALLHKREKRKLKREFKDKLETWKLAVIERDSGLCQKCLKALPTRKQQHSHHLISLQQVKRKYPELLENIKNGILLCARCHKFAPDSAHQGSLEFILWFKDNKQEQYAYLNNIICKS